MSIYDERRDELEKHEFMMGKSRGQLAVTLDVLTDALVLVGQHGVYCQSARTPGKPAMDIQIITKSISDAKELIAGVMADLKVRDSAERIEPLLASDRRALAVAGNHHRVLRQRHQLVMNRAQDLAAVASRASPCARCCRETACRPRAACSPRESTG